MMQPRGHTIIHYGHSDSSVLCDENVAVTNNQVLSAAYGDYNWRKENFKYDLKDIAYQTFYSNAIREIARRKKPLDFLLCFWGWGHKTIADAHQDMLIVEPGIGYPGGVFAPYRVFESQSIMAAWNGMNAVNTPGSISWYDAVIPNYFDLNDFEYNDQKEDYFLCLGRVGEHKGVHIAIQATQEIGSQLIIAGQGSLRDMGYDKTPAHVEEVGYADAATRRSLMSGARGQFVATTYAEPFGGVQIEAMLSGTPVISTDWGCFGELNLHGITGYRCRTFDHFAWAADNIDTINPLNCREWGENFSFKRIAPMFEEYCSNITQLYDKSKGWYNRSENRCNLNWLYRRYPSHPNRTLSR